MSGAQQSSLLQSVFVFEMSAVADDLQKENSLIDQTQIKRKWKRDREWRRRTANQPEKYRDEGTDRMKQIVFSFEQNVTCMEQKT